MARSEYIGARYVPLLADPVEWSPNKSYEALTIVTHEGNSFTSRQYVPVGIEITNNDFWAATGNYNAQVEEYRREVLNLREHVDEVTIWHTPFEYGAKGDGITDDTAAFMRLLEDECIYIPDGTFLVDGVLQSSGDLTNGLRVKSNTKIIGTGAIKVIPNSLPWYAVLNVTNATNVYIEGISFVGDKNAHDYDTVQSTHEWGAGIKISGSKNVSVINCSFYDFTGDAVSIAKYSAAQSVEENIFIDNCVIHDCRRNGISVTFGHNIYISNSTITKIGGIAPQQCIDIEPDAVSNRPSNIYIYNNFIENDKATCIEIWLASNVHIYENTINCANNKPIGCYSGTTEVDNESIYIHNNVISATDNPSFEIGNNTIIVDNIFDGVRVTVANHARKHAENSLFKNNFVTGGFRHVSGSVVADVVTCENVTVSNNVFVADDNNMTNYVGYEAVTGLSGLVLADNVFADINEFVISLTDCIITGNTFKNVSKFTSRKSISTFSDNTFIECNAEAALIAVSGDCVIDSLRVLNCTFNYIVSATNIDISNSYCDILSYVRVANGSNSKLTNNVNVNLSANQGQLQAKVDGTWRVFATEASLELPQNSLYIVYCFNNANPVGCTYMVVNSNGTNSHRLVTGTEFVTVADADNVTTFTNTANTYYTFMKVR